MAILVACDINYFNLYAKPLANSLKAKTTLGKVYFSVCLEERSRTAYAKQRFYDARKIDEPELIILDADTVVVKDFTLPEGKTGLILRPDRTRGLQVAAGMVVVRDRGFLDAVCSRLDAYDEWTADQRALWEAYEAYKSEYFDLSSYVCFGPEEGDAHKPVWSAKGNRKKYDKEFLRVLESYQ